MALVLIAADEETCAGSNFPGIALRTEVWRDNTNVDVDVAGNDEDVYVKHFLIKRGASGSGTGTFNNGGACSATATVNGGSVYSQSGINYDWRSSSGLNATGTVKMLWQGWVNVPHNADGTKTLTYSGTWTGDSNVGSASTSGSVALPAIVGVPSAPTGVAAAWVSDASIDVTWAQSSPSNSQPTSNQVEARVNGGAWVQVADISPTTAVALGASANQKIEYRVRGTNSAGSSAWSAVSAPVYTTPGAPTLLVAVKDGADIDLTFTENVAYSEYEHEVWHGTVAGAVTTWDGAALTTLATGVLAYTHVAPNPAQVHVYRVRSKAGARLSGYATSNEVQLLTAPAKPTIPALAAFADKASTFRFPWVHNSIDSSAQTKYQWRWSTNGGAAWTTGAKTTDTDQYHDFAGGTWTANQAVTFQVRTKGAYDSGADGDASYSPWSDSVVVTFKTVPVATITTPADLSTVTDATLSVTLGFAQAEAATYVKAQLELLDGAAVLLETLESVLLVGITMATPVQNGDNYTIRARVQDSNGLWSAWVESDFDVAYTLPVAAGVTLTYLPATGWGQIDLSIPAPGGGEAAATTVSITRTIDGVTENVVIDYPVASVLTFLDTTPVINGTNTYTVTTKSAIGAQSVVIDDLVTAELRRAFLSKGVGYSTVGVFGANLSVDEALSVASDTVQAAGRTKPIGMYGVETEVSIKVKSFIYEGFGSTIPELRAVLLVPGKACYRDASGRRVFGTVKGGVSYKKDTRGDLTFTMNETS